MYAYIPYYKLLQMQKIKYINKQYIYIVSEHSNIIKRKKKKKKKKKKLKGREREREREKKLKQCYFCSQQQQYLGSEFQISNFKFKTEEEEEKN